MHIGLTSAWQDKSRFATEVLEGKLTLDKSIAARPSQATVAAKTFIVGGQKGELRNIGYAMDNIGKNVMIWFREAFLHDDEDVEHGEDKLVVHPAPEPNEILWRNLSVSKKDRMRATTCGHLAGFLLIFLSVALVIYVKLVAIQHAADALDGGAEDESSLTAMALTYGLSVAVTMITCTFDVLLTGLTTYVVRKERHTTSTGEHKAIFDKLVAGYLLNSVAVPVLLGMVLSGKGGQMVDQTWYEANGTVATAMNLLVFQVVTPFTRHAQLRVWLERLLLKRSVASQLKMDRLYKRRRFDVGKSVAFTAKVVALGLVYGPIFPAGYMVAALVMLWTYAMVRMGLRASYARPDAVSQELLMTLRRRLANVLILAVFVQCIATLRASSSSPPNLPSPPIVLLVGKPLLLVLYAAVPLSLVHPAFKRFNQLDPEASDDAYAGTRFTQASYHSTHKPWGTRALFASILPSCHATFQPRILTASILTPPSH